MNIDNYARWDQFLTNRVSESVRDWITYAEDMEAVQKVVNEKMEDKKMDDRNKMNSMNKGDIVLVKNFNRCGKIEAFDYVHGLIGVRLDNVPSSAKLVWAAPPQVEVRAHLKQYANNFPKPRRVIYDEDAGVTVVLWEDGQKTIVRAASDEDLDVYDAFCAAYCKRIYGSNSALKRELNKILTVKKKPEVKTMLSSSELGAAVKKFGEDIAKALNTRNK